MIGCLLSRKDVFQEGGTDEKKRRTEERQLRYHRFVFAVLPGPPHDRTLHKPVAPYRVMLLPHRNRGSCPPRLGLLTTCHNATCSLLTRSLNVARLDGRAGTRSRPVPCHIVTLKRPANRERASQERPRARAATKPRDWAARIRNTGAVRARAPPFLGGPVLLGRAPETQMGSLRGQWGSTLVLVQGRRKCGSFD